MQESTTASKSKIIHNRLNVCLRQILTLAFLFAVCCLLVCLVGAITFVCGILGTVFGGYLLDYRKAGKGLSSVVSSLELCTVFVGASMVSAAASVVLTIVRIKPVYICVKVSQRCSLFTD